MGQRHTPKENISLEADALPIEPRRPPLKEWITVRDRDMNEEVSWILFVNNFAILNL